MSSKYIIHTATVPHRFEPLSRSGVIAWEEGCLKCAVCVKDQCVYSVYEKKGLKPKQMIDSLDNKCMDCFRCVQNCPKELIHKSVNPEYKAMGDPYWTPDIIKGLWAQAETGKIPVSGAGYSGPFSGPGFDSMWTDMSEIVRPTRDGIHGREYISTAIDLGENASFIEFNSDGTIEENPRLIDVPVPIILRIPSFGSVSEKTIKGWVMAAGKLGTFMALPFKNIPEDSGNLIKSIMPVIYPEDNLPDQIDEAVRIVELVWSKEIKDRIEHVKRIYPGALISVSVQMEKGIEEKIHEIIEAGCSIISLEGTFNGRVRDDESVYIKDFIRSVHRYLVNEGLRDRITLLAEGGIAMAEHVAKAIICGADGVFADFSILIALECRMCRRCTQGLSCPVEIENADQKYVSARTINLIGAWHSQLLEVMGAMGIRDVRRLRGETGRAMFFEDLDREIFGKMSIAEEGFELE